MTTEGPSPEEVASYNWGGQRARPRKGIEAKFLKNETYLKPPVSCGTKYPGKSISVNVECCEGCEIYILDVCEGKTLLIITHDLEIRKIVDRTVVLKGGVIVPAA